MDHSFDRVEYLQSLSELEIINSKCVSYTYSRSDVVVLRKIFSTLLNNDNHSTISFWMKMEGKNIRLEFLWELQRFNYVEFTTYIYHNPDMIPSLSNKFTQLIWSEDESAQEYCAEVVAGLLAVLCNLGAHSQRDICVLGQKLLTSIIEEFVAKLLGSAEFPPEPVPFLIKLAENSSCAKSRLQVFNSTILKSMVQYDPDTVTLEDAVCHQSTKYTSNKASPAVKQVFSQVLSNLTEEEVIHDLAQIVSSGDSFNWGWLLIFVSVFADSSNRSASVLKDAIDSWVLQACVNKDSFLLAVALLCARQACAKNTQQFGSYSSWFGNLQVRPAAAFVFLFNFLSELVPHEPVLCLKIHVNKVPSAPPNCHAAVADYAVLAKTRLADLNQTTDYMGLFGEYTTSEQEGREDDVRKVVSHFKQTKEVMKIILEASVFRRQFYEKVFLTELLKGVNRDHVELIEKLYSIGKIPHGLYNKWKLNSS